MRHVFLPVMLCVSSLLPAQAQKNQAMALVKAAAAYAHEHGKAALLHETNMGNGRFHVKQGGDLYIFVFDTKGNALAHGFQANLVNINRWDNKDADGKLFVQDFVKVANAGGGWVDYRYPNPKTNKVEAKTSYVEMVDGMIIGCGVYR